MKLRSVRHKALRRFLTAGDASGLPTALIEKIRNTLSYIQEIEDIDELRVIPNWEAHVLTGDRKRTWSLTVTRNWRMTFRIDADDADIVGLDFEDYH
jgi:proteic killer suppression protein